MVEDWVGDLREVDLDLVVDCDPGVDVNLMSVRYGGERRIGCEDWVKDPEVYLVIYYQVGN